MIQSLTEEVQDNQSRRTIQEDNQSSAIRNMEARVNFSGNELINSENNQLTLKLFH